MAEGAGLTMDYGTDTNSVETLPLRRSLCSGARNVGNALARRLQTPFGSLTAISDDYGGDYGYDVRELLNGSFSPAEEARASAQISAQCLADERVADVEVEFVLDASLSTLTISLDITLTDGGTFTLVLGVSSLTVEILRNA